MSNPLGGRSVAVLYWSVYHRRASCVRDQVYSTTARVSVVSPCRGFGVWSLSVATAFIVVFQLLSRIAPCPQPILSSVASSSRGVVDASPLFAAQLHKQVPVRPSEVKLCGFSAEQVAIITVLQLPPKLSRKTDVIMELRYGI